MPRFFGCDQAEIWSPKLLGQSSGFLRCCRATAPTGEAGAPHLASRLPFSFGRGREARGGLGVELSWKSWSIFCHLVLCERGRPSSWPGRRARRFEKMARSVSLEFSSATGMPSHMLSASAREPARRAYPSGLGTPSYIFCQAVGASLTRELSIAPGPVLRRGPAKFAYEHTTAELVQGKRETRQGAMSPLARREKSSVSAPQNVPGPKRVTSSYAPGLLSTGRSSPTPSADSLGPPVDPPSRPTAGTDCHCGAEQPGAGYARPEVAAHPDAEVVKEVQYPTPGVAQAEPASAQVAVQIPCPGQGFCGPKLEQQGKVTLFPSYGPQLPARLPVGE